MLSIQNLEHVSLALSFERQSRILQQLVKPFSALILALTKANSERRYDRNAFYKNVSSRFLYLMELCYLFYAIIEYYIILVELKISVENKQTRHSQYLIGIRNFICSSYLKIHLAIWASSTETAAPALP